MGIFDDVKERVTVRQVMEQSGIKFNRNNMCKCPFHNDKTASMKAKPDDKKCFCFGCGARADAIDFVSKYYGLSLYDSANKIANDFGIIVDKSRRSPPKVVERKKSILEQLKELEKSYYSTLCEYRHVLKDWERDFAPKSINDDTDSRYIKAINELPKIEYYLDILWDGDDTEKRELTEKLGKDVIKIESICNEYRECKRNAHQDRER